MYDKQVPLDSQQPLILSLTLIPFIILFQHKLIYDRRSNNLRSFSVCLSLTLGLSIRRDGRRGYGNFLCCWQLVAHRPPILVFRVPVVFRAFPRDVLRPTKAQESGNALRCLECRNPRSFATIRRDPHRFFRTKITFRPVDFRTVFVHKTYVFVSLHSVRGPSKVSLNPFFHHFGEIRSCTITIVHGFLCEITYCLINGNRPISKKKKRLERFHYRLPHNDRATGTSILTYSRICLAKSHVTQLSGYHNGFHPIYECVDKYLVRYVLLCFVNE